MDWIIKPYQSMGSIRFGMSPMQIEELLGPPKRKRVVSGVEIETRGLSLPHIYYLDSSVVEVEMFRDGEQVVFEGQYIFHIDKLKLREILFSSEDIFEGTGLFVFYRLGISTNIFHTSSTSSVTAFAGGYWGRSKSKMMRIK